MGGDTELKRICAIHKFPGVKLRGSLKFYWLGKGQLNDLILYWVHILYMGAKFHNLGLGPKA